MFVIFGATGNVGDTTATQLRRTGHAVRAVVREIAQGDPLAALGCEIVTADLLDPQSVEKALRGADAVQVLCPLPRAQPDPAPVMRHMIGALTAALRAQTPRHVLALSDYGAEHASGTGITTLFHELETQLGTLDTSLTFLRAAEHMHNWARVVPIALAKGALPSLHDPVSKLFPTVAAQDVGVVAAELLLDAGASRDALKAHDASGASRRIVSVESATRVSAEDVARTIAELAGRDVTARATPRSEWSETLRAGGMGEPHARLIVELFDAHNAGRIDVETQVSERRFGTTTLAEALAPIVARAQNA